MKPRFALAVLAPMMVSIGLGGPINVSEPPDFPGSAGPTYVLDVGTNTVTGSVFGCDDCLGTDLLDEFSLTLPAGFAVTSGFLVIGNFSNGGGINPTLGCFTDFGCFGTGGGGGMTLGPGTTTYTAKAPFSLGTNGLNPGGFDYTLTFVVESSRTGTPEPATYLMVVSAIGCMVAVRRMRAR